MIIGVFCGFGKDVPRAVCLNFAPKPEGGWLSRHLVFLKTVLDIGFDICGH